MVFVKGELRLVPRLTSKQSDLAMISKMVAVILRESPEKSGTYCYVGGCTAAPSTRQYVRRGAVRTATGRGLRYVPVRTHLDASVRRRSAPYCSVLLCTALYWSAGTAQNRVNSGSNASGIVDPVEPRAYRAEMAHLLASAAHLLDSTPRDRRSRAAALGVHRRRRARAAAAARRRHRRSAPPPPPKKMLQQFLFAEDGTDLDPSTCPCCRRAPPPPAGARP